MHESTRVKWGCKFVVLLWAFTVCLVALSQTTEPQNPDAVLQQFYIASGGGQWKRFPQAELSGTYMIGGMTGTFQQVVDLRHGRDVLSYDVGPLQGTQATLPTSSWEVDRSGLSMIHEGPEAIADAITQSFVDRNGWFHPDGADVTFVGQRADRGRDFDLVRIVPHGGRELILWIDIQDHLLKRIDQESADHEKSSIYISDYRRVEGVLYPFTTRQTNGDASQDTVQRAQVVHLTSQINDVKFTIPKSTITDAQILGTKSSTSVPFTLADGRVVIEVSINGHPALPFLLDTGAGNLITPAAAKEVGVEGTGSVALTGVGTDQENGQFATIEQLRVGPLQISNQQFGIAQLPSFLQDRGGEPPIAGLLGYELLRRFPTTFDYETRRLTFYKPGMTPDAPEGSQTFKLYFNDHTPFIQVGVDSHLGYFGIDTGDSSVTTIFGAFYDDHHFPVKLPVQVRSQGGFGGMGTAVLTRIGDLSFGLWTIQQPLININFASRGLFSYSYTGGNLGFGILNNFSFTLDYARRVAYLKRAKTFGEPEPYNRSGMTFQRAERGAVVVERVNPKTPAAESGMQIGDRILSLNGKPPTDEALYRFEDVLSGDAGSVVDVQFTRGGRVQETQIVLRELLPVDGPLSVYKR
jgi:hypothetical protein